jgi:hypothetical protein
MSSSEPVIPPTLSNIAGHKGPLVAFPSYPG